MTHFSDSPGLPTLLLRRISHTQGQRRWSLGLIVIGVSCMICVINFPPHIERGNTSEPSIASESEQAERPSRDAVSAFVQHWEKAWEKRRSLSAKFRLFSSDSLFEREYRAQGIIRWQDPARLAVEIQPVKTRSADGESEPTMPEGHRVESWPAAEKWFWDGKGVLHINEDNGTYWHIDLSGRMGSFGFESPMGGLAAFIIPHHFARPWDLFCVRTAQEKERGTVRLCFTPLTPNASGVRSIDVAISESDMTTVEATVEGPLGITSTRYVFSDVRYSG